MPRYCTECSPPASGKPRQASFGPPDGTPRRCAKHRINGDVDVKSRRCECNTSLPSFGPPSEKAIRCARCKQPGDIDLKNRRCDCGASVCPLFGPAGGKPTRCAGCKHPDDVDVKSRRCECGGSQPSFGKPGGKPTRCARCKLPNDVNVKSPRCECDTSIPSFGPAGGKPTRCSGCKYPDDVNVKSPRCECGSSTHPLFGPAGGKATRCARCRQPEDVDLKSPMCATCGLWHVTQRGRSCADCMGRPRHTKEARVKAALESTGLKWIHDTATSGNYCDRVRPDFYLDCGSFFIVVECDELWHQDEALECRLQRQARIVADVGKRGVFLRFNPDPYPGPDGARCNPSDDERHRVLLDNVWHWLEMGFPEDSSEFFITQYLFYP